MAWSKAYNRIIWQNEPSTDTPLNATNLNKMDAALNEIDNRVLQLENQAYVHIKYSAYPSPTSIQMKDTPDAYMGICVTSESTAPTQASSYTWNRVRGEKIMLRSDSGYMQYKYEDDVSWINLIPLSSLKGADGQDGRGIVSIIRTDGDGSPGTFDTYAITYSDGQFTTFQIYNGADGEKGDKGDVGPGLTILGTFASVEELESSVTLPNIGDIYNIGLAPPYNLYLWDGVSWKDQGQLQGPQGEQGEPGEDGRGISSIARTSGNGAPGTYDTYTITFTDNTTTNFQVYNGTNGIDGQDGAPGRGIVSITRTSGTGDPGTTDTYTITYSDSTTSTFTVYNGADGQGSGDMTKAVYDTDNDGKVDSAEDADKLGGQLPSYYAKASDIPDVSGKADKVTGATNGNFAGLDANGNLIDSGKKADDFATIAVYTATLNTTWTGSAAPYSQTVTVSGVTADDTPIIDIVMSGTYSTDVARQEAWSYVYRAVTDNDSITFYASDIPTVELPIQIKVVR